MADRRQLGTTDLQTFPLNLGGGVFGWTADKEQSFAVLDAYAEGGGNFIDTADTYGSWVPTNPPGISELIIGEWLRTRGNRDEMLIATKVGQMPGREGLSAANIERSVEGSLERLGIDCIDLYYAHEDDPAVELTETMTAFDAVVQRGQARYVAASNYSSERLSAALAASRELGVASYVALQTHYSLAERPVYEAQLRDVCMDHDVSCLSYHSLANGFLTGKYQPGGKVESVRVDAVAPYQTEVGFALLDAVEDLARVHEVAPAAIALAWLNAQPTVGVPVASARTVEQLNDLMGVSRVELTAGELARLDAASQALHANVEG